jgi:hypothetical protein
MPYWRHEYSEKRMKEFATEVWNIVTCSRCHRDPNPTNRPDGVCVECSMYSMVSCSIPDHDECCICQKSTPEVIRRELCGGCYNFICTGCYKEGKIQNPSSVARCPVCKQPFQNGKKRKLQVPDVLQVISDDSDEETE